MNTYNKIWAYLLHLGYNMWGDPRIQDGYYEGAPKIRCSYTRTDDEYYNAETFLRCDMGYWRELAASAAASGVNMLVVDIGEAVCYESHPELACKGALTKAELAAELEYLRSLGIEPIPKLNFSACHDMWLKPYSYMKCTPVYYEVCSDLIHEVCELFSQPRFFHLGMDEEKSSIRVRNLIVERQEDLWWHDLLYFVKQTEQCGTRAWIWSDYMWDHEKLFLERMPKEVVQSNWYYSADFEKEKMSADQAVKLRAFTILAEKGYDQIPSGSNWSHPDNFSKMADYIKNNIDNKKVLGFMQTLWRPTLRKMEDKHKQAIGEIKKAIGVAAYPLSCID